MNQLCRVCGEPAAGFHFGAFTCEGCKSFFGRSYNNLSSISECKNNGECVINKKNRTACKACRLRKCLLVGMSKSGSRYGRRSNWFKIHCLLQQQQQQQVGAGVGVGAGPTSTPSLLPPHPFYLHPRLAVPSSLPPASDTKSSESDSGASSADPDDEGRSSAFSLFNPATSPGSDLSTASSRLFGGAHAHAHTHTHAHTPAAAATATSPGTVYPRWLPPLLWLQRPIPLAVPAPEQNEPIDLTVKKMEMGSLSTQPNEETEGEDDEDSVDVGVEEAPKSVPINLSRDSIDGVSDIKS